MWNQWPITKQTDAQDWRVWNELVTQIDLRYRAASNSPEYRYINTNARPRGDWFRKGNIQGVMDAIATVSGNYVNQNAFVSGQSKTFARWDIASLYDAVGLTMDVPKSPGVSWFNKLYEAVNLLSWTEQDSETLVVADSREEPSTYPALYASGELALQAAWTTWKARPAATGTWFRSYVISVAIQRGSQFEAFFDADWSKTYMREFERSVPGAAHEAHLYVKPQKSIYALVGSTPQYAPPFGGLYGWTEDCWNLADDNANGKTGNRPESNALNVDYSTTIWPGQLVNYSIGSGINPDYPEGTKWIVKWSF